MIIDERNEFADAGSLIANADAETVLGDVMDLGGDAQDIGNGEPLYLVIQIDTAVAAAAGAANITFALKSADNAALSSNPVTHWQSAAIAKGTLVAGYRVVAVALPIADYSRYLGVTFTPDTNNITAGKANAFLVRGVAAWQALADGL